MSIAFSSLDVMARVAVLPSVAVGSEMREREHHFAVVGQCVGLSVVASQQDKDDYRTGYDAQ